MGASHGTAQQGAPTAPVAGDAGDEGDEANHPPTHVLPSAAALRPASPASAHSASTDASTVISPLPATMHARLDPAARMVVLGCGCIGQGVLPMLLRHVGMDPAQLTVLAADDAGEPLAKRLGVRHMVAPLDESNYVAVLDALLPNRGDFLLNLSVNVSSVDLVRLARKRGWLYLDTSIEPWEGGFTDASVGPEERSNYSFRERMLALRDEEVPEGGWATAVVTHGANPGLVSHFAKRALVQLAARKGMDAEMPAPVDRLVWTELARKLGVKVIQIAERDTQAPLVPKRPLEFVNDWSVDGFLGEASQPSELGWGTHETSLPPDGRTHPTGPGHAIYLARPGCSVGVRSWTPLWGPYIGLLITHGESVSIPAYLTLPPSPELPEGYRPTVMYAYHPCDAALASLHELLGRNLAEPEAKRVVVGDLHPGGIDELGVLLCADGGVLWYGSVLECGEAAAVAPGNNATSLQVAAGVLGGVVWAIENPNRGLVEPDEMDGERVLEVCAPYLGKLVGAASDWTPLKDRGKLFPEDLDRDDPWQFMNFRVAA
ncbi:homospermidine synthase [Hyaloraphidium curvatum]|nr:homospermidine synthase [Hyaloraphidium curvatum]